MAKISVIVPIYNVELYLKRCVDSILSQSFEDFTVILVNDGSKDNCSTICDQYANSDSRVKVIHKENGGLADARNAGLDYVFANCNSEWLCFIDSDDLIHPDYLNLLYTAAIRNNVSVSCCQICSFSDEGYPSTITPLSDIIESKRSFSDFYGDFSAARVSVCIKLYKKELFTSIRFPKGKLMEDAYVTYRVLYDAKDIVTLNAPLYYYFIRYGSIMNSKYSLRMLDGLNACKEQYEFFKAKNEPKNVGIAFTQLIHSYASHCKSLMSDDSDAFQRKRKELRKELRYLIRKNKALVRFESDRAPIEVAFPKIMWCYWTAKAIKDKVFKN